MIKGTNSFRKVDFNEAAYKAYHEFLITRYKTALSFNGNLFYRYH